MRFSLVACALLATACTPPGTAPVCSPAASYSAPVLRCASVVEIVPPPAAPPAAPPPAPAPPRRVEVREDKLELDETVQFETDSSTLAGRSRSLLDEVASQLQAHPQISRVQIEGHTDAKSSRRHNQTLSEHRAAAVKAYLVQKGVRADRLVTKGFGETRPVGDNATEDGRFKNRRVDFVILKRE
jgi:OOP family OmpA-OmpF porin